jgi:putative IMPACT (imprinted ancient) family translation regulator
VSSIVPLKGVDLDNFMSLYRPTFEFVKSNNGETMAAYINDSYKKYMALPADKKKMPKLNGEAPAQP